MKFFYHFILVLLSHNLKVAQCVEDLCNHENTGWYEGCPTDCSQMVTPISSGPAYLFNCSVGNKAVVNKYKSQHQEAFQEGLPKLFDAPKLLAVTGSFKVYKNQDLRYLSITFQVPKAVKSPAGIMYELPKAVLMEFRSVADQDVQDVFYYQCPRERLFWFQNNNIMYQATDPVVPHNLTYDCLVGLDSDGTRRVYLITLTSAFGRSVTYTVTTYAHSRITSQIWFPVIATYLDDEQGTIHVVFEGAPAHMNVQNYNVELIELVDGKDTLVTLKQVTSAEPLDFNNLSKGKYVIKVKPTGCVENTLCSVSMSYVIDATTLKPKDNSPIHYLEEGQEKYILAIGIVCMVILFVALIFIVWKVKQKCPSKSGETAPARWGWIIHPYEACSLKETCVKRLANYLEEACHCKLHPLTIPDSTNSVSQYCRDILHNSSFLLVVDDTDKEPSSEHEGTADDFYDFTINEAVQIKQTTNRLHVIPIKFPFSDSPTKRYILLKDLRLFYVMKEIDNLYCTIQGEIFKGKSILPKNTSFESLENMIAHCTMQMRNRPTNGVRRPAIELQTKEEALEIIKRTDPELGARPKEIFIKKSGSVDSPDSSPRCLTLPPKAPTDQGTRTEFNSSFNKYTGLLHEQQQQQNQYHQNHPDLSKPNLNRCRENFQHQDGFPMDRLDMHTRHYPLHGGSCETSSNGYLIANHNHIDHRLSGPNRKQGHSMEAQFGSPYDSGSYHSSGYTSLSNREPFLSYPNQQGLHHSDQRQWLNHSMSAPYIVMDGVPYEYMHGEVPYAAINGAQYDSSETEVPYIARNGVQLDSLENEPLLRECSFVSQGLGTKDRKVLFSTDYGDTEEGHQPPIVPMTTEHDLHRPGLLCHFAKGHRISFIPPDDDLDESIFSSQELLDQLLRINSQNQ